jgi:Protein of unknown function (DUF2842)
MTIRTRKLIGAVLLILLAAVWSLLAMAIAQAPIIANSGWLQATFYVVVGLGWVLPAMPLVTWMSRPRVVAGAVRGARPDRAVSSSDAGNTEARKHRSEHTQ